MKRTVITSAIAGLGIAAVMVFAGASVGATADGKSLFVSNKCNSCHSLTGQGIAMVAGATSDAPDLSGVGLRHNAAKITGYLNKTVEINGAKHVKKFKGSDADLAVLSTWLGNQKRR